MHVLYFHQYFTTPSEAGGTRSYEMARRLIERGHRVTMICGSVKGRKYDLAGEFKWRKRNAIVDGIRVIEFDLSYSNYDSFVKRSITFFRFALQSIGITIAEKYDLIFSTSTPLTVGIPGIVGHLIRRKPFVFEVRDLWPELPREMGVITNPVILKAMDLLEWLSYHSADTCIGLSPGIVEGIKRRGIDSTNVTMIPNGCDLDLFDPEKFDLIRSEGVKEGDFIAIFIGAHGIANRLDAVLDAALELRKRGRKDIKLVFIGDGKLKPKLKRRAGLEQLDNCVFLNPVPKKELASLLQGVDVGMMILANVPAFYYGTSPNKFFDYITAGLPVLNNYPGWLADMISAHKCGMVVPPENPKSFADALEYLADHPDERAFMAKNARVLAEQFFNRRKLSDKFVDLLEEIYAQKKYNNNFN